ncbi:MAG: ATPase, T2SS/T4P/T4SS family [Candidatus Brocadiia bacterium]
MVGENKKRFGEILKEMKLITAEQLEAALKEQKTTPDKKIGQILVAKAIITPGQVTAVLSRQTGLKFVRISSGTITPEIIKAIPSNIAVEYKVIPIKKEGKVLTLAVIEPPDIFALDNLRFALNAEIDCVLATEEEINMALGKYYAKSIDDFGKLVGEASGDVTERGNKEDRADMSADDAPVIKLVNTFVSEAVKTRASDIHLESMEDSVRIRYRIDGICREIETLPKRLQAPVLSRIKLMAGMDISEKRKPQDGRIPISVDGRDFDIRASALPSTHGESIVLRLLEKQSVITLESLGFHPDDYTRFKAIIKKPSGVFLITGPTGSGKTTTLYAALKELNKPNVKIITAEDPVEYVMPGINQSQVRKDIGLTFAAIIRSMLRQAPNIILVGEIRDMETAETAIQAALTGHLVFSTLHTNDACSAVTRLLDMGTKPFLVASAVQAIMAQRLIRLLCPKCKSPQEPSEGDLAALGLKPKDVKGRVIYKAVGCPECGNEGYRGRKGIYELLEINSAIRDLIFKRSSTAKIFEQAKLTGMVTLLEDGVRKIVEGLTSVEEILLMTKREDISY